MQDDLTLNIARSLDEGCVSLVAIRFSKDCTEFNADLPTHKYTLPFVSASCQHDTCHTNILDRTVAIISLEQGSVIVILFLETYIVGVGKYLTGIVGIAMHLQCRYHGVGMYLTGVMGVGMFVAAGDGGPPAASHLESRM